MPGKEQNQRVAEFMFKDAEDRLGYQQKFSAEGFKTLILINGGAIVGLLTYLGNTEGAATQIAAAFIAYVAGLVLAMLAFLAGFLSQSSFRAAAFLSACRLLGLARNPFEPAIESDKSDTEAAKTEDDYKREGDRAIYCAIGLCSLSVCAFVTGSVLAMIALS